MNQHASVQPRTMKKRVALVGTGNNAYYKHTIRSKKFGECEYRFGDPLGETHAQQVFKFQLCGASGLRKANYVGYQMSYDVLMPSAATGDHNS